MTDTLHNHRPTVLFVDDDDRILSALNALFRLRYEVITCANAPAALPIVRERRPHVVVSDQRMPQMSGVEFLRQVRDLEPSSMRILLTGYSDLAAIVGSINEGEVFRFVNKPWGNQELRDTLAEAVDIAVSSRRETDRQPVPVPNAGAEWAETVLIAEPRPEIFTMVSETLSVGRPLRQASNVSTALEVIEQEEVAVLLCDLDRFQGADVLLKMLKQTRPRLQSVAIATASDSSDLISLINEAQIFRFMTRPLRAGLLERAVKSAMAAHANFKTRPALSRRQAVQPRAEVTQSSIGRQILQRIALLASARRPGP